MLEVIYLELTEGYSATAGDDWVRPALCEEALRLGRNAEARREFQRAAAMTRNTRQRALFEARAAALR